MTDPRAEPASLDAALRALLAQHPEALVAALGDDGFRVPMPPADPYGFAADRLIPLPADRATMLDLVVAADRMTVITTWERARRTGIGTGTVRTLTEPEVAQRVTIVDVRPTLGTFVGILAPDRDTERPRRAPGEAAPVPESLRPRTATLHKNMFGMVQAVDERTTRMLGWEASDLVGSRSLEFLHPDDHERAIDNWMHLLSTQQAHRVRYRHRCRDGSWLWVEVEHSYRPADDPDAVVVVARITDISDEMAAQDEVHQREQLFHRLAESLPMGLLQLASDRTVVYANARLERILGLDTEHGLADPFRTVVPEDRGPLERALGAVLDEGIDSQVEVGVRVPASGELRRCGITLATLTAEQGAPGAIVCVMDVTESARMREELRFRATFDVLTGCHNRASVMAALEAALAGRDGHRTAVVFVDLDRFKDVNDVHGHAAGDELLVHAARRLTAQLRAGDLVGRLGGDEFLVVCQDIESAEQAEAIAERIRRALEDEPAPLSTGPLELQASVGVACVPPEGATADALVARADAAMYAAKHLRSRSPHAA
jgi:diguanylate cyclase (GGDEF)-like protein/PAS domain S-box-containing protein